MPSNSGSPEPQPEPMHPLEERALRRPRAVSMAEFKAAVMEVMGGAEFNPELPDDADFITNLIRQTPEEHDRIADGEPYCFRCGKPASSFEAYGRHGSIGDDLQVISAADYVRQEEGTYNPETNRFACDGCYIAIGMPAAPGGWRAP